MADTALLAGRYRLIESIGRGPMSEVWRAADVTLGRQAAIKLWSSHDSGGDTAAATVWREARDAARLVHPNVARIYDVGTDGDLLFLVTELVPGRDLAAVLAEQGPLPTAHVAQIGAQAARVLAVAHAEGIVHRGVKPGNVLVMPDGTVKLTDFGTAASLGSTAGAVQADAVTADAVNATAPDVIAPDVSAPDVIARDASAAAAGGAGGLVVGSGRRLAGVDAYVSPEQAVGLPAVPASDLYALGCVLYELLVGHPPFADGGDGAVDPGRMLRRHVEDEPPPPGRLRPDIPAELEHAVLRMLAKNPADRPATADRIAEVLQAIAALQSISDG